MPDVPTVAEAGVPGYEATIWLGIMAPAGTPKDIVEKLNAEINKVLARADLIDDVDQARRRADDDEPGRVRRLLTQGHRQVGRGGKALRREGELSSTRFAAAG